MTRLRYRATTESVRHTIGLTIVTAATIAASTACGGGSGAHSASSATSLTAAVKLQQQGRLGEASALYRQVIASEPSNIYANYDLGVVEQASANPVGALSAYGAALTINPKYVPALYNEATIYTATDSVLAISLYRKIVALQPTAPTAYLNLGLLEIQDGAAKQGLPDLATAVRQDRSLLSRVPKHLQAAVSALASSAPAATPSGRRQATTKHGAVPTPSGS